MGDGRGVGDDDNDYWSNCINMLSDVLLSKRPLFTPLNETLQKIDNIQNFGNAYTATINRTNITQQPGDSDYQLYLHFLVVSSDYHSFHSG